MTGLKTFLCDKKYIPKNFEIAFAPFARTADMYYVEGLPNIKYIIKNDVIFVNFPIKFINEAVYLITYFTQGSDTIVINDKKYEICEEGKNVIKLFELIKQNVQINYEYGYISIQVEEEGTSYAKNSIAYIIDANHHDDYYLNIALDKLS